MLFPQSSAVHKSFTPINLWFTWSLLIPWSLAVHVSFDLHSYKLWFTLSLLIPRSSAVHVAFTPVSNDSLCHCSFTDRLQCLYTLLFESWFTCVTSHSQLFFSASVPHSCKLSLTRPGRHAVLQYCHLFCQNLKIIYIYRETNCYFSICRELCTNMVETLTNN